MERGLVVEDLPGASSNEVSTGEAGQAVLRLSPDLLLGNG